MLRFAFSAFLVVYWNERDATVAALIQQTAWVLYINWGTTTVAELIIATTLVYWLYQQRTGVNRRQILTYSLLLF
jgi:hypothetical protein